MEHTLVVVRHAKSDWSTGGPDERRPLAKRGRRDAPEIGRWLAASLKRVDLVVCSPATRARQTWDLAGAALDPSPPVQHDARVYGADDAKLRSVLEELPDELGTVVLVGHNPGLSDLVRALSGQPCELKTSAVAVLAWTGSWADVWSSPAELVAHVTPRDSAQRRPN
jgi:phosphohistidine phosphatase